MSRFISPLKMGEKEFSVAILPELKDYQITNISVIAERTRSRLSQECEKYRLRSTRRNISEKVKSDESIIINELEVAIAYYNDIIQSINNYLKGLRYIKNYPPIHQTLRNYPQPFFANIHLFIDDDLLKDHPLQQLFLNRVNAFISNRIYRDGIDDCLLLPINYEIISTVKKIPEINHNKEFLFLILHTCPFVDKNNHKFPYHPVVIRAIWIYILTNEAIRKGLYEFVELGETLKIDKALLKLIEHLTNLGSPMFKSVIIPYLDRINEAITNGNYQEIYNIYNEIKTPFTGTLHNPKNIGTHPNTKET